VTKPASRRDVFVKTVFVKPAQMIYEWTTESVGAFFEDSVSIFLSRLSDDPSFKDFIKSSVLNPNLRN